MKASNNPKIIELFEEKSKILGYRTVCELHFHNNEISVYDHRKRLNNSSIPFNDSLFSNSFQNYNKVITQSSVQKSTKRKTNSLEIIEINQNNNNYRSNKRRKFNNNYNNIEIIEIEDNRTTNNEFLLGHELFNLKKSSTYDQQNDQQLNEF